MGFGTTVTAVEGPIEHMLHRNIPGADAARPQLWRNRETLWQLPCRRRWNDMNAV